MSSSNRLIAALLLASLWFNNTTTQTLAATTTFHHLNHLNSPAVSTDGAGQPSAVSDFAPYGNETLHDPPTQTEQRQFGGHEFDPGSDLTYFGVRYFDARDGHFISPDPIYASDPQYFLYDPQQLNAYRYARNNPVRFVDDAGEAARDVTRAWPTAPVRDARGEFVTIGGRQAFAYSAGERMATYKGVAALSNGENTGSGFGPLRQQCVGFAKAFYQSVYGISIGKVDTATGLTTLSKLNSVTSDTSGQRQFSEYKNGFSPVRPKDDDMIGWRGGSFGHAAIIAAVSFNSKTNRGYVDVVEQNWGDGSIGNSALSRLTLTRDQTTGAYSISDRGSYKTYGWFRLQPKEDGKGS